MNNKEKRDNIFENEIFNFPNEKNSSLNECSFNKSFSKISGNNNSTSSIISIIKMFNEKDQDNISIPMKKNNYIFIKLSNDNSSLKIDFSLSEKGYPDILSKINYNTKTLILEEKWIDYKTLKDYFTYVKFAYFKRESLTELSFNYKKLTLLANYFQCEKILGDLIKYNLEPNINNETCISLINDSFQYCTENLNKNIKSKWFSLFLKLRDYLIENFLFYLQDQTIQKFQKMNKKLLNELVETFLFDIYAKGIEITSIHASKLVILINYIREENNYIDSELNYEKIFLMLKNSYLINTSNSENYKFPSKPTYSINIMKDITFNYQEKLIKFYKQECIFISLYNKNDDTFSISLKLNPINNIEAFSFISYGHLIEDYENNNNMQVTYHTINSNNTVNLFTINNFRSYINYMKGIKDMENLILEINLKFCVIESFVICYLKSCFSDIIYEESIKDIPSNFFNILLYNINSNQQYKEEDILTVIQNWLNDDLNYKLKITNIQEIFEQIVWKKIPLGKIFEFVIKFPLVLEKLKQTENDIISSIFVKANEKLKEMKKDKLFTNKVIYDDKKNYLKNNTIDSYEGELERCEAIINENEKDSKETKTKDNSKDNNNFINNDNNNNLITNENQINLLSYFFVNLVECSKKLDYQKLQNNSGKKETKRSSDDEDLIEPFKFKNIGKSIKEEKEDKKITEKDENIYQTPITLQDDIKLEDDSEIKMIKTDEKIPTLDFGENEESIKINKETNEKNNDINETIKEEIEEIKEESKEDIKSLSKNFEENKSLSRNTNDLSDCKINSFRSDNINNVNKLSYNNLSRNTINSNKSSEVNYKNVNEKKKNFKPAVKLCSIVLNDKFNKQSLIYDSNKKEKEKEKENQIKK